MKKLLLIGNAPLPKEKTKSRPAAGLRTQQFLEGLRALQDWQIRMVNVAMPECYGCEPEENEERISKNDPKLQEKLQAVHDGFEPDVIVSINTYPSFLASKIRSSAPLWADLNGWIMAEAQAQAHKMESNDYLPHYFQMEKAVLLRADKLSTVSEAQKWAATGELASLGRINKDNFGRELVHHIPNGTEVFDEKEVEAAALFEKVPADAFVLLWVGGYNTWVDEITLFEGIEKAMKTCEKLYFVSTGGAIAGLDNKTFAKFQELIEKSVYKERFVFLGWVETEQIPYIYRRAKVGVNVDRACVETFTGARNRVNEMMKFGLPVISTLGSEISFEMERCGAGIGVESGNSEDLSAAIQKMYESENLAEYSEKGQVYIKEQCNYKKTVEPLIKWLQEGNFQMNRSVVNLEGGKMKSAWRYLKENGVRKFLRKVLQKI